MITCLVQELQYAVSAIAPTIGNETNGHAGIRIKTHSKKDRIRLSSTEGNFATDIWIDGTVRKKLDFIVEGDRFAKYISKLDAKEATILLEDDALIVKSKRGKPTFKAYSPQTFPDLPRINSTVSFHLAGKVFKKLVGSVAFATKPEKKGSEQPLMEGINILSDGNKLTFTTMNGFVIASCKKTVVTDEIELTVAKKSLVNAAKLARDDDKVTIQAEASRLIVKHNDITYYIPVYSGSFPHIPMPKKDFMTSFSLDRLEILGVLERGSTILEEAGVIKGILQVEKGKVIVEGETQRNHFNESITTDVTGKKTKVTFDLKRLAEILRNVEADRIVVGINTGKPVTIRGEGRSDHTCLLAVG